MSDPIGYNGSVIDYSGFPPCDFCGGNNCEHRVGTEAAAEPAVLAAPPRFERRPEPPTEVSDEPHDLRPARRSSRSYERSAEPRFGDPPSARATATIRRPDGTTITCPVDQIGEVLEQIRRSTPSVLQHRCDALETAVRAGLVEAQTTVNRW